MPSHNCCSSSATSSSSSSSLATPLVNNTCDNNNEQSLNNDINCLSKQLSAVNVNNSEPQVDNDSDVNLSYINYESEKQMSDIMRLIEKDLSEPYSIYTYRYFIHNWPHLCFLVSFDTFNCDFNI